LDKDEKRHYLVSDRDVKYIRYLIPEHPQIIYKREDKEWLLSVKKNDIIELSNEIFGAPLDEYKRDMILLLENALFRISTFPKWGTSEYNKKYLGYDQFVKDLDATSYKTSTSIKPDEYPKLWDELPEKEKNYYNFSCEISRFPGYAGIM
jgi:hypothetical protein